MNLKYIYFDNPNVVECRYHILADVAAKTPQTLESYCALCINDITNCCDRRA